MSWDEALFGWLYGAARKLRAKPVDPSALERRASLSDLRDRLRWIASALAERPMEIREAEGPGTWRGDVLFLPAHVDLGGSPEENALAYVAWVAWVTHAGGSLALPPQASEHTRVWAAAYVARDVVARLRDELPSAAEACVSLTRRWLQRSGPRNAAQAAYEAWLGASFGLAEASTPDSGLAAHEELSWTSLLARVDVGALEACPIFGALGDDGGTKTHAPRGREDEDALPTGTERKGRAVEHLERVELPDDPLEDNPLVHSFEKVHTAEEYRGGVKNQDGEDQMADQIDALDELDLRQVVRSMERTRSLLRVDVMLEGGAGDVAEGAETEGTPYPEWDAKRGAFREAWCRVKATRVARRKPRVEAEREIAARAKALLREHQAVRAELERLEASRRWKARQLDGSEIDEDAVVDRHACLAARTTPPDRLHRRRRRAAPSLAAMVLLDASLSTDGWVDDVRVLDLEIDAAVTLGEALASVDVELGVAAFHSHTRLDCRFEVVKSFVEPWETARHRLASLEPRGYTRIGPALRHATELLSRTEARRRLLLVLTDGKPNDYDRYEGRHGVADVRHAVLEAERRGIHIHAFAIDHDARFHLPRMIGNGRYHLLRHPRTLPLAMGEVLASMRA
ncbi:MAG: VWA domain-containing protein [Sandaracinus sp.]|nr:VWA domain-containing protein [Sandaracinus sp.]MCB9619842.1 VWA domain-containing protein [Sandaracinus sp.]MCB9622847.1 VWA domain-containing protein [Sandaracinus sp.]